MYRLLAISAMTCFTAACGSGGGGSQDSSGGTNTQPMPEISVSGSSSFGNVTIGNSTSQTLTITNDGNANLEVGSLSTLGTPYALSSDSCSNTVITAGNSCSVTIQFTPSVAGSADATLNIPSNDSDEATTTLTITGTGEIDLSTTCDYDCLGGDGSVSRSAATYDQLTSSSTVGLVNYSAYAVPNEAANPSNTFEGTLTLSITDGTLSEQGTNEANEFNNPQRLPDFSYQFVQHGTHIIPLDRGLLSVAGSDWEYILAPGRVWDENGDNNYSRVALPFAIQERNANCTHNGVMTFLFNDSGAVSQVAYQIAQETCGYFKFNLHGEVTASYTAADVSGAAQIKADYETEVSNRMPTKNISALATDYPSASINTNIIGSEVTPAHMTLFGVAYNGVNYVGGCETRQGTYPYCDVMAVPSYSTAKSVVGGFGLMRIEHLYSGSQQDLIIGDYVNECSGSQWDDVTFEHTLDMATGNYTATGFETDESSNTTETEFFVVDDHAGKATHACAYNRMATPGSTWVYHTSDTYLLGRGINLYYQSQTNASADLFNDLLVDDIYKPLGMSPTTYTSKRTYDSTAQFWAGYGLTYHRDDAVKLGEFLNKDNGQISGEQLLDPTMLDIALQKNSGDRGLDTGVANLKYQKSFWAYNLNAAASLPACTTDTWVPYMSGYGGITILMLPNDMVYYAFSDNYEHLFTTTVAELNKIGSVCP